jgi:two-component system cell cycle sensor histidine kinase/response regulator CckA
LRNSLETRGYHVIEARDGAEGILQSTLNEGVIDLLITDVVMPAMDGPAMARNLAVTRPGIKVVFISGCPEDLVELQELVNLGAHYVQKPFSQRELLGHVDRILGGGKMLSGSRLVTPLAG